ncbi:MAG: SURF1 family protein [Gemmatimonadota bacterium]|nr:MAG: SURF1 family protein [Gemmatimonadota bacterium]
MKRSLILAVALATAAVCTRLGIWQLDRLEQRRAQNTVTESRLIQPALQLPTRLEPDSLRYRKAIALGTFDFEREIVVVGRSRNGVPAVHVVTPLKLNDGEAVLVERGLALSPDARTVDLGALRETDTSTVTGVLVSLGTEWSDSEIQGWPRYVRGVDPAELQVEYPYSLFPLVLRRTANPPSASADLSPVPVPELTNGPHLSYAVQWFSFAAIVLVGSVFLINSLKKAPSPSSAHSAPTTPHP